MNQYILDLMWAWQYIISLVIIGIPSSIYLIRLYKFEVKKAQQTFQKVDEK